MPAGSDGAAAGGPPVPPVPSLPTRFRPLGVRVATWVFGAVLAATVVAVWLALPANVQDSFTWLQRGTVLLFVAGGAVIAHAMSRCRVDADEDGLTVVNGYRTHRLDWGQVVAVSLRPGSPWAVLDLSDGTTRAAMGIQGSDGLRARRQTRSLRALIDAHDAAEPDDRQPPP